MADLGCGTAQVACRSSLYIETFFDLCQSLGATSSSDLRKLSIIWHHASREASVWQQQFIMSRLRSQDPRQSLEVGLRSIDRLDLPRVVKFVAEEGMEE